MFMDEHDRIINYDGDRWPLPEETFSHPQSNGTFAKVLRAYVRERKLMSMQKALRKMCLKIETCNHPPARKLKSFTSRMVRKFRVSF